MEGFDELELTEIKMKLEDMFMTDGSINKDSEVFKKIFDLVRELCHVDTWEGVSRSEVRGLFIIYTKRIMEVLK